MFFWYLVKSDLYSVRYSTLFSYYPVLNVIRKFCCPNINVKVILIYSSQGESRYLVELGMPVIVFVLIVGFLQTETILRRRTSLTTLTLRKRGWRSRRGRPRPPTRPPTPGTSRTLQGAARLRPTPVRSVSNNLR